MNKYRKKNGRKALKMDRGLTNSAIMRGFETTIYIPETSPHRRPNGKLSKVSTRRSSMKTAHNPQKLHRSRL